MFLVIVYNTKMTLRLKTILYALLGICIFSGMISIAQAETVFNPAYIISDQEILDSSAMSLSEIQNFLAARGSFLANYQTVDKDGNTMSAAQAIYDRATNNKVSPKFILVLIQKEQGLVENPAPSQGRLDWAAGYGCPDGGGCNSRWQGFWKQINSASLQFRDYMDNPQSYRFKAGGTYTFNNPYSTTVQGDMTVTIVNQATAALYNYTPHVYNGNYNFWKLWQKYFTRDYLNGSLLQASGDSGVWLIENGYKRAFLSRSALTSRYDPSRIQIVGKADIDKYPTGDPIKFADYSIIRVPDGKIYLLVGNSKRRFANPESFRKAGFNPEEIISAAATELSNYQDGAVITTASTYATGALLQDKKTGGVYWVIDGTKAPIWDGVLLKTKFKGRKILGVTTTQLAAYTTVSPVSLSDGDLVRTAISPTVYVIENGIKRPFVSGDAFEKLGYKWTNVITVSPKILMLHADGEAVTVSL